MTLVPGPLSVPASCAFTQLRSVWCEIPSSRATSRMFCPSFTRFTASVLNSVVYSCFGIFNIAFLPFSRVYTRPHGRRNFGGTSKRLKHRLNLEHVSGLSQRAVVQDLAGRVLCDNLQDLTTLPAHACHELPPDRRINRAYVHSVLKPLLPSLLLAIARATSLPAALALIARHTFGHRPGISKQREPRPKSHKSRTQKPC